MLKGILNSIFQNAKNQVERSVADAVSNKVANSVTSAVKNSAQNTHNNSQETSSISDSIPAIMINGVNFATGYNRDRDYFTSIIHANFSDYSIEENVPVSRIKTGASDAFKKLDYVLSSNGKIVAAIAIVPVGKHASRAAAHVCREQGVKYIPFHCTYENAESYVVNRIKDKL